VEVGTLYKIAGLLLWVGDLLLFLIDIVLLLSVGPLPRQRCRLRGRCVLLKSCRYQILISLGQVLVSLECHLLSVPESWYLR
jgi:hypothetical protein